MQRLKVVSDNGEEVYRVYTARETGGAIKRTEDFVENTVNDLAEMINLFAKTHPDATPEDLLELLAKQYDISNETGSKIDQK